MNQILKQLAYALSLSRDDIREIFELGGRKTSKSEVMAFTLGENHRLYRALNYETLIQFVNGLVKLKRKELTDGER